MLPLSHYVTVFFFFLPRCWKHRITISLGSQCEHNRTHIHRRQLCILLAWLISAQWEIEKFPGLVGTMLKHIFLKKLTEVKSGENDSSRSSGSFKLRLHPGSWEGGSLKPRVEMSVGIDGLIKSRPPWPVMACYWLQMLVVKTGKGAECKQHKSRTRKAQSDLYWKCVVERMTQGWEKIL